jgi:hypothetical protein
VNDESVAESNSSKSENKPIIASVSSIQSVQSVQSLGTVLSKTKKKIWKREKLLLKKHK